MCIYVSIVSIFSTFVHIDDCHDYFYRTVYWIVRDLLFEWGRYTV